MNVENGSTGASAAAADEQRPVAVAAAADGDVPTRAEFRAAEAPTRSDFRAAEAPTRAEFRSGDASDQGALRADAGRRSAPREAPARQADAADAPAASETAAEEQAAEGSPAAKSQDGAAAAYAREAKQLRFRERVALAKREWTEPVDVSVQQLEELLLTAGAGARSLVMGLVRDDPLWALNLGGYVKWLSSGSAEEAEIPQEAPGTVQSIDLDSQAKLIHTVEELESAGEEANRFCGITLGADLTHVV